MLFFRPIDDSGALMTILNRWPDEELLQHRNKPTPIEEQSLTKVVCTFVLLQQA